MQQKLLIFSSLSYLYIHHIYRSSLPSQLWQPRPLAGPRKFSVWHNNTPLPRTVLCRHTQQCLDMESHLSLPTIGSPRCSLSTPCCCRHSTRLLVAAWSTSMLFNFSPTQWRLVTSNFRDIYHACHYPSQTGDVLTVRQLQVFQYQILH